MVIEYIKMFKVVSFVFIGIFIIAGVLALYIARSAWKEMRKKDLIINKLKAELDQYKRMDKKFVNEDLIKRYNPKQLN